MGENAIFVVSFVVSFVEPEREHLSHFNQKEQS